MKREPTTMTANTGSEFLAVNLELLENIPGREVLVVDVESMLDEEFEVVLKTLHV